MYIFEIKRNLYDMRNEMIDLYRFFSTSALKNIILKTNWD